MKRELVLIAHNLRSCHNVGSLFRTAEGLGLNKVYLTGYTPYPASKNDTRLPHIQRKNAAQISKTSLGAEEMIAWQHTDEIKAVISDLKDGGYTICALEQTNSSVLLPEFKVPKKLALIVGREVEGVEPEVIAQTTIQIEIPMSGRKESFNVVQAAAMALYHCKYI